ncbi:MAG: TerB family tellurite resistance protein [Chitinophagaceae bacterium]
MKTILILFLFMASQIRATSQEQEIQQLLLNVEKLSQFKKMLSELKKGYEIVAKGYTAIKDISEGNFSLHEAFLDGLLAVSPTVRKYKRIQDIISLQVRLVKEYKAAWGRFRANNNFTIDEIGYIGRTYDRLLSVSMTSVEDLATLLTAGKLRMSDHERLSAIDRIYEEMKERVIFLRQFNNSTSILAVQRAREKKDVETLRSLHDIK